ncbi:MAG: hypothetical protein OQK58_11700, partial [Gammaproteobacteria bacterium]|nr:hypothetical protein [Gammaproteobacteria bacterium]
IVVMVKESDGSILDMTNVSSTGTFNLDLTIMDTPSLTEIEKLVVEVKDKSGAKKNFLVKEYISNFNNIVLLEPIILK